MNAAPNRMVDMHCHMLPGIDDGSGSLAVSLQMARMAVRDGIETVIVTPHQLGNYRHNTGPAIRRATSHFQDELNRHQIPLRVLPGADVRIEEAITQRINSGDVLSLGDHRKHVLLELPHELYFPLEPILKQLKSARLFGILSHPERNQGLLRQRKIIGRLVDAGCLMQVTAGSLTGSMGPDCQEFAEWMLHEGLVHFVATDAHGIKYRRPLLRPAYDAVQRITDTHTARDLCIQHPRQVADGQDVPAGRRRVKRANTGWFGRGKAG